MTSTVQKLVTRGEFVPIELRLMILPIRDPEKGTNYTRTRGPLPPPVLT
jgi:hypothetical protein